MSLNFKAHRRSFASALSELQQKKEYATGACECKRLVMALCCFRIDQQLESTSHNHSIPDRHHRVHIY